MIDSFSPATRKFIAVTILFFAILFCVNIVIRPAIGLVADQLVSLADARFQRARLEAIQDRPLPATGDPVPTNLYIRAASAQAGQSALLSIVNERAGASGIALEQANIVPVDTATPQRVAVDLSVSGPELALASFINDIEAHRPMLRFVSWKITASAPGQGPARMSARAIAIWSPVR